MEERTAPLRLQESYDNAGLQVGDPEAEITGVLICLDVTEKVIEEAIGLGYNLVLSHHPLIFKSLHHLTGQTSSERCVMKALRNHIAVYSAHTNLDSVLHGVSAKMAERLGLQACHFLSPSQKSETQWPAGLGMVGNLPDEMDEYTFLTFVKSSFAAKTLRHSALRGKNVRKVALCGGSGAEFLEDAVREGADAYLTADVKYHQFQQADGRLLFIDAGHYETEQFTKELLYGFLSKNIPNFAVRISEQCENPVKYF